VKLIVNLQFSKTCSSPDLNFLEAKLSHNLGVVAGEPINRSNPVNIDVYTNEAANQGRDSPILKNYS
jgi:hypothetical protein